MIAHVAQRGEDRGRVVLQMCSSQPNPLALLAAVRLARAFQSEIESLFVEDSNLFDCAAYGFVRETSLSGRSNRPLSAGDIAQSLQLAARGARRQLEQLAQSAEVPMRSRVVRGEPMRALSIACAETGPWNVVVLSEPFTSGHNEILRQIFAEIEGTTGLLMVGPRGRRVSGPTVVAVEDIDRLPDLLRAAERISALEGAPIVLLLVAPDEQNLAVMDHAARLILVGQENARLAHAIVAGGMPGVAAEALRRQRGGFVICQYGGLVFPDDGDLSPLAAGLECPIFLVR
jgi:hypothetical protein